MKKLIVATLSLCAFLFTGNDLTAQTGVPNVISAGNETNTNNTATPANVLKWTKEALPKIEQLSTKLEKIKLDGAKDQRKLVKQQELLRNVQKQFEAINAKGTKLTAAEAKRYDTWFRNAILKGIDDCLTANPGSECCFGCKNGGGSGYGSFWCLANCFVARFPGIN
jgi:hypothetical protein